MSELTATDDVKKDETCYLSVDLVGFLPPAVEQVPSFILNITDVDVIAIVFTKWYPSAAKHKQVVAM